MPDDLAYLHQWVYELHGRSGFTQLGLVPLTYTTIRDWAAMKGLTVEPHEVDALIQLDAVLMHPVRQMPVDDAPVASRQEPAWPTRHDPRKAG